MLKDAIEGSKRHQKRLLKFDNEGKYAVKGMKNMQEQKALLGKIFGNY